MAVSFADLLADVRKATRSVTLEALKARIEAREALALVDVREVEETRSGMIPGAIAIPRGMLEMQIEARIPDRAAAIVVYCAGGARSALAAKTLTEMGYRNVETASPGFDRWKELGYPIAVDAAFDEIRRARYARHLLLPEIGVAGQKKLLDARVLVLGAGGLGSPAALYLAAAGVGTLGLVDADRVDLSNLQRQILHATSRVGAAKVDSAEVALRDLNPDVKIVKVCERADRTNIDRLFREFDVVVDGCDNFPTRYLVNDASVFHRVPVVHGSVFRFEGRVTVFDPRGKGPCYRCLYPEPPDLELAPSCSAAGVLGVLPGVVGVIQATEAIKLVLARGRSLAGRLLIYDALEMRFREVALRRSPACAVCGDNPSIRTYQDYEGLCAG